MVLYTQDTEIDSVFECSEYGNPLKKRRAFLSSMAKLDDNIVYLCFSQVRSREFKYY